MWMTIEVVMRRPQSSEYNSVKALTQAVTTEKRSAQEAVVALLFPQKTPES